MKIPATDDFAEAIYQVDEDQLKVSVEGSLLGSWPLSDLQLDDTGTEIHLVLDGESVVANVVERDSFVEAITPPPAKKARHARKRRDPKPPKAAKSAAEAKTRRERDPLGSVRRLFNRDTWRVWLSDRLVRWGIAAVAVIIVALLALFATNSLGMILILLGMVSLVIAALAVSEDLTAFSWVPGNLSETTLVIVGAIAMLVGGGLILIG